MPPPSPESTRAAQPPTTGRRTTVVTVGHSHAPCRRPRRAPDPGRGRPAAQRQVLQSRLAAPLPGQQRRSSGSSRVRSSGAGVRLAPSTAWAVGRSRRRLRFGPVRDQVDGPGCVPGWKLLPRRQHAYLVHRNVVLACLGEREAEGLLVGRRCADHGDDALGHRDLAGWHDDHWACGVGQHMPGNGGRCAAGTAPHGRCARSRAAPRSTTTLAESMLVSRRARCLAQGQPGRAGPRVPGHRRCVAAAFVPCGWGRSTLAGIDVWLELPGSAFGVRYSQRRFLKITYRIREVASMSRIASG